MKKIFLLFFALVAMSVQCCAQNNENGLSWQVKIYDPTQMGGHYPRSPIEPPTANLDGYTFTITGAHPDYLVRIVDVEDEDDVIYQTLMPAATSIIILPSTLSGDYQIQLIWDIWMFYGLITL